MRSRLFLSQVIAVTLATVVLASVLFTHSVSAMTLVTSIKVGHDACNSMGGFGPNAIAFDSAKGELFVSSFTDSCGVVDVISDATNTIVAHIDFRSWSSATTGNDVGLAYDPGKGEIFLAVSAAEPVGIPPIDAKVFVISDSTNSVVATVSLGHVNLGPMTVVYDSAKGEIFVAGYAGSDPTVLSGGNKVWIISDTSNTVVATVKVIGYPTSMAYDPAKGEVFVANTGNGTRFADRAYGDTVSVISDMTNTVVANITGLSHPGGVAYDPLSGAVLVNYYANGPYKVSEISDSTNKVVSTNDLQYGAGKMEVDSPNNRIFMLSYGPVIMSESTKTVIDTLFFPISSGAIDEAYDSGKNEVFVVNDRVDTVSVISAISSNFDFGLSPGTPSSLTVAQGGTSPSSSFSATLTTGTASPITFSASGLPSGVTANLNINQCTPTCTFIVSFSATLTATLGTATVTIIAAGGGASHSTIISLTVSLPPGVLASSASSVTVNSGTATADHTPTTGVAVHIFGSTAADGTLTTITTQALSSPGNGVGMVNLSGVKYYDVRVSGITSGTAKVCINYSSASSKTTMEYWAGTIWTTAANININGATACGAIPVSALTGTNIAVGGVVPSEPSKQAAPSPPQLILGVNPALFYEIVGGLIALVATGLVALVILRRRTSRPAVS